MKNIQVIDGAANSAYDIFQATDEEFRLLFPTPGQDIQFNDELPRGRAVGEALGRIWQRNIDKKLAGGIHGTIFYQLEFKKKYYPNRREQDLTDGLGRHSFVHPSAPDGLAARVEPRTKKKPKARRR